MESSESGIGQSKLDGSTPTPMILPIKNREGVGCLVKQGLIILAFCIWLALSVYTWGDISVLVLCHRIEDGLGHRLTPQSRDCIDI